MYRTRRTVAVLLLLVGLVWIGQGAGLIAGSFMTGSSFWLLVGIVLVVAAAAIAWTTRARPRP